MGLAEKLAAPQFKDLQAYQSARRIGGIGNIYLNANESPYPAFRMSAGESWQRYPDFLPAQLTAQYAAYAGVPAGQVITTRGADEGIDLMVRAFCEPRRDAVIINPPTYSMYEFIARAHQVDVIAAPLSDSFDPDVEANCLTAPGTKLIFFCCPNNPTGNLPDRDAVIAVAERNRNDAFVIIDEAYIEYCPDHSFAALIDEYPNLVVLRTLSKAFGLAAIRIGFLLADPEVIALLAKLIAPYPIPDPSARIALNALSKDGIDYMRQQRDKTLADRERYRQRLAGLACVETVYPSATNFLLMKLTDSDEVFDYLRQKEIILRDQSQAPGLSNHLRITIGTAQEMEQVITCLSQLG